MLAYFLFLKLSLPSTVALSEVCSFSRKIKSKQRLIKRFCCEDVKHSLSREKKNSKKDTSRELNKRKVARFFGPWNQWALDTPQAVNLFLNHYLRALFTSHRKINHSLTKERRCPTSGHDKPGNISRRSFSPSIMRTQRKCWHNF